jgi:hypothetical protein
MQERSVDGEDDLERMGYTVYSGNRNNRCATDLKFSDPQMLIIEIEIRYGGQCEGGQKCYAAFVKCRKALGKYCIVQQTKN